MKKVILVSTVILLATLGIKAQDKTLTEQELKLKEVALEWIEVGWSPKNNVETFDFETNIGHLYIMDEGQTTLHDGNANNLKVFHSAREHGALFEKIFKENEVQSLDNKVDRFNHIQVCGDMGFTSFIATAIIEDKSGTVNNVPILYSLLWNLTDEGWKVKTEHGTKISL